MSYIVNSEIISLWHWFNHSNMYVQFSKGTNNLSPQDVYFRSDKQPGYYGVMG